MTQVRRLPRSFAVRASKLRDYLLKTDHPIGGPKAVFFLGQGFSLDHLLELADALVDHAMTATWHEEVTRHGTKFVFEGELETPSGKRPTVRSIWLLPHNDPDGPANFVSAYPRGPS